MTKVGHFYEPLSAIRGKWQLQQKIEGALQFSPHLSGPLISFLAPTFTWHGVIIYIFGDQFRELREGSYCKGHLHHNI